MTWLLTQKIPKNLQKERLLKLRNLVMLQNARLIYTNIYYILVCSICFYIPAMNNYKYFKVPFAIAPIKK